MGSLFAGGVLGGIGNINTRSVLREQLNRYGVYFNGQVVQTNDGQRGVIRSGSNGVYQIELANGAIDNFTATSIKSVISDETIEAMAKKLGADKTLELMNGMSDFALKARATEDFCTDISGKYGVNIKLSNGVMGSVTYDGMYDETTNTIYFNDKVSKRDLIRGVAMHEITHSIQADTDYRQFSTDLIDFFYGGESSQAYVNTFNKTAKKYDKAGAYTDLTEIQRSEKIRNEVVADTVKDFLFETDNNLQLFVKTKPTAARRVLQSFVGSMDRMRQAYVTRTTQEQTGINYDEYKAKQKAQRELESNAYYKQVRGFVERLEKIALKQSNNTQGQSDVHFNPEAEILNAYGANANSNAANIAPNMVPAYSVSESEGAAQDTTNYQQLQPNADNYQQTGGNYVYNAGNDTNNNIGGNISGDIRSADVRENTDNAKRSIMGNSDIAVDSRDSASDNNGRAAYLVSDENGGSDNEAVRNAVENPGIKYLTDNDIQDYLKAGTRQNKNRIEAYEKGRDIILKDENEVRDYIYRAIHDSATMNTVAYSKVDDRLADAISKESKGKINVKGAYLELVPYDLEHAYNSHGSGQPGAQDTLPIREFLKIPEYIQNFDYVAKAIRYKSGFQKITLIKVLPHGNAVIIETASKSHGSLEFKTMHSATDKMIEDKFGIIINRTVTSSAGDNLSHDSSNAIPVRNADGSYANDTTESTKINKQNVNNSKNDFMVADEAANMTDEEWTRKTIEENLNLAYGHMVDGFNMRRIINKDGKMPMPSIAVLNINEPSAQDFGDITLGYPSNYIDPKTDSTVSGDNWTIMYPRIIAKLSQNTIERIKNTYEDLKNKYGEKNLEKLERFTYLKGGEGGISVSDIEQAYNELENDTGVMRVFLAEAGIKNDEETAILETAQNSGYKDWLSDIFNGIYEKTGFWNGKDRYTNSGKERSFEQLHIDDTAENVLAYMVKHKGSAKAVFKDMDPFKIFSINSLIKFKSQEHLKSYRNNIRTREYEENIRLREIEDEFDRIASYCGGPCSYYEIREALGKSIGTCKTVKSLQDKLSRNGIYIDDGDAKTIIALSKEIGNMPFSYFEAKPARMLNSFDAAFIELPANTYPDVEAEYNQRNIPVYTYDPNIKGDRARVYKEACLNTRSNFLVADENANTNPDEEIRRQIEGEQQPVSEPINQVQQVQNQIQPQNEQTVPEPQAEQSQGKYKLGETPLDELLDEGLSRIAAEGMAATTDRGGYNGGNGGNNNNGGGNNFNNNDGGDNGNNGDEGGINNGAEPFQDLVDKYGAMPQGEQPRARDILMPNKTGKDRYLSQFARNLYEANATTKEMLPVLNSGIRAEDFSHERISSSQYVERLERQAARNNNKGINDIRAQWESVVNSPDGRRARAYDIAAGQFLYNQYVKAGQYDDAIRTAAELAIQATEAGRAVNALFFSRLNV